MKVIIAGSRGITMDAALHEAIEESGFHITEVISGGAKGVDTLGQQWATSHHIPITRFPADWKTHGKAAGPIRNRQMAAYADGLIAVWDGQSRGTADMLRAARAVGLRIYQYVIPRYVEMY